MYQLACILPENSVLPGSFLYTSGFPQHFRAPSNRVKGWLLRAPSTQPVSGDYTFSLLQLTSIIHQQCVVPSALHTVVRGFLRI